MREFCMLTVATLLALGAGAIARHGWLEKDPGYFFLGTVLLAGSIVAVARITAAIVKRRWLAEH